MVHRNDEEPAASPIEYLERWAWHNEFFGDSVEFIGTLDTPKGLRLIISQPAIKGKPASEEEIDVFFRSYGWTRVVISGDVSYFDSVKKMVISDTHRGNIIAQDNSLLRPIDLRVQQLNGTLLDTVRKLS